MENFRCYASKFSSSLLFSGNQNIENHLAAAEVAINWNADAYIFALFFLFRLFDCLPLCVCFRRVCLWRIINFSNACNFKINRLSGWRELVDETYFYFYATCHVTNFVLAVRNAAQRFMHSFGDSVAVPLSVNVNGSAKLSVKTESRHKMCGASHESMCVLLHAPNKQQLDYNLMHAKLISL